MRVLIGHIQRVVVVRPAVAAYGSAGLHCIRDQSVVGQVNFCDVCGSGESCVNQRLVANRPLVAMVVRCGFVQRCSCFGFCRIHHGCEHVVIHLHQLGRVFGLFQCFSHHHGHVVAHIAHLALRQDGVWRLLHRVAVCRSDAPAARQAVDLVVGHIGAHKNIQDARCGFGRLQVDAPDIGMCVR